MTEPIEPEVPLNRFEALVQASELAVLIFADEALADFALVNARDFKLDPRYPRFLGVTGILGRHSATVLQEVLDSAAIDVIASAVASYVAGRIAGQLERSHGSQSSN